MAQTTIGGVKVLGIAAAVPEKKLSLEPYYQTFGREEVDKIIESTGIKERRSDPTLCTSDLCLASAESLLAELKWKRSSIDLLIFLSQTADYPFPATACCLHGRLGLDKSCAAFDVNLGCSGYPYGLWMAASLMASGGIRRCLFLAGDTASRDISPLDRSTAMIFGDAGTATALELSPNSSPIHFTWGSDGTGWETIIRRAGGQRFSYTPELATRTERDNGNFRAETDISMNGADVFSFTIREVPKLIVRTLDMAGWDIESTDTFVLHQANKFMLQHLAKKAKIPPGKLPISLAEFGNTSSASIPITIVRHLPELRERSLHSLLIGFGVGLSWASAALELGPLVLPPIIEVKSATTGSYSPSLAA
ncbi:MAG: ketoacyl-ACP synthase III [Methylacidiphilales bacterium]|nr:ketoacyl-ACP synthase III [Candidatus Methylacidiphilales bacterium]